MAYIDVPDDLPGIRGLMAYSPETALPLNKLVDALLQKPSSLSKGERELIASYVSSLNNCKYCSNTHGTVAKHHLGNGKIVQQVWENPEKADVSLKMKALLRIAGKVQRSGRDVTEEDIENARNAGADDKEIHDSVLIAAAFCMFNRYVDGLGTSAPDDPEIYDQIGAHRAQNGYQAPNNEIK